MECCNDYFWLLCIGFFIAFLLAFGIGANDVANTFGTSVGAKVLTLRQACILATIFETLGSILIGAKVSGTIRKGILDPMVFKGHELELMLGYISALLGCCIWLIIATACGLPVSGTHSIVGSTIGMAIISKGINVIKWFQIVKIASSWVISPLLSGIVSALMFLAIKKLILTTNHPLRSGLAFLPFIYTITIFINLGGIMESAPPLLAFDKIPWWGKLIIICAISIIVYLTVYFLLVPYLRNIIKKSDSNQVEMKSVAVDESNKKTEEFLERTKIETEPVDATVNKVDANATTSLTNETNFLLNKLTKRQMSMSNPDYENSVNLTLEGYLLTFGPVVNKQKNKPVVKAKSEVAQFKLSDDGDDLPNLENTDNDSNQDSITSQTKSIGRFTSIPVDKDPIPTKFRELFHRPSIEEEEINESDKLQEITVSDTKKDEENLEKNESDKNKIDFSKADPPETIKLFSFLQIMTAIFGSFAHGGNDVSNAIGPLIGLYLIYKDGVVMSQSRTPEWILFYGGAGISLGLWILGRRVIKTIGEDLTKITPSSGFVIELASAMTVLAASLLNIPVSSTHCKVGSVVFTGRVRSKESVDWSLFRNIIIAWAVTVPITGMIAALCQIGLKFAFKEML